MVEEVEEEVEKEKDKSSNNKIRWMRKKATYLKYGGEGGSAGRGGKKQ